jgi:hypothetical protein
MTRLPIGMIRAALLRIESQGLPSLRGDCFESIIARFRSNFTRLGRDTFSSTM